MSRYDWVTYLYMVCSQRRAQRAALEYPVIAAALIRVLRKGRRLEREKAEREKAPSGRFCVGEDLKGRQRLRTETPGHRVQNWFSQCLRGQRYDLRLASSFILRLSLRP